MELYRLSYEYSRIDVLDEYQSFIWTERYSDVGDFEIVGRPSKKFLEFFVRDAIITHSDTDRIAQVNYINTERNANGELLATVKGKTFEHVLDKRVTTINRENPYRMEVSGTVGAIASYLVNRICVDGEPPWHTGDIITELSVEDLTSDTGYEYWIMPPDSLYTWVKKLCQSKNIGFRIRLQQNSPKLKFETYQGVRRYSMIFGPAMGNMSEEAYLYSRENLKTVAYVWSRDLTRMRVVYPPWGDRTMVDLKRNILNVDASNISPLDMSEQDFNDAMEAAGQDALSDKNEIFIMDGLMDVKSFYKYGRDYNLGDTVTVFDVSGIKQESMVTEYIWTHDATGLNSYPTFKSLAAS